MRRVTKLAGVAAAVLIGAAGCAMMRPPDANAYIDDSGVSARVKDALVKDRNVKATEINVQTYQGAVTLSGVVDSDAMARRAEQITRGTSGVKSVQSDLQVANPSTESAQR